MLAMQPEPVGHSLEESVPSVVVSPTPPPGGAPGWAYAHSSLVAVLVLVALVVAAIALWRTDRRPAMVLVDEDEPDEVLDRT
jgi:hypothetical protein